MFLIHFLFRVKFLLAQFNQSKKIRQNNSEIQSAKQIGLPLPSTFDMIFNVDAKKETLHVAAP